MIPDSELNRKLIKMHEDFLKKYLNSIDDPVKLIGFTEKYEFYCSLMPESDKNKELYESKLKEIFKYNN